MAAGKKIGKAPFSAVESEMKYYFATVETPIGWLTVIGSNDKLVEINWPKPTKEAALAEISRDMTESKEKLGELVNRLRLYFNGERVDFSDVGVSFDHMGAFEQRVLRETMKIPYGRLTTYGALAVAAGSPRAARAVGNTMRKNPLPIVVPCHRVVHSDGGLGGYAGGLHIKRMLLDLEGASL